MKMDLLKCKNCRFRAKVDGKEKTGRIQIVNNCIKFWFDYHDELNDVICHSISMKSYSEYDVGEFFDDLEIVPRNSNTYKDWQVGDKVKRISDDFDPNTEVVFRSGEFVVCKTEQGYASINYLCDELFNEGYRLVLTDIEKQIIDRKMKYKPQDGDICYVESITGYQSVFISAPGDETSYYVSYGVAGGEGNLSIKRPAVMFKVMDGKMIKTLRPATEDEKQQLFDAMAKKGYQWNAEKKCVEDIPKPYEFRKGEPVLVRDTTEAKWLLSSFMGYNHIDTRPFCVTNGTSPIHFYHCIPYNEKTMHLLGTTEDYEEGK